MHVEQGRVGVREELLLDQTKAHETHHGDANQTNHHEPTRFQCPAQQRPITAEQEATVAVLIVARAAFEEVVPQQRSHRQR